MAVDAATRAWLKKELTSALGFGEVDDIAAYVTTEFRAKDEAAAYLVELLGIPAARANTIGARLFPPPPKAATPLVPPPAAPSSRIKPAKRGSQTRKTHEVLHARVINCLRCGRIERNAARTCAFCRADLRYEPLPDDDAAALVEMQRLVAADEAGEAAAAAGTGEQLADIDEGEDDTVQTRSERRVVLDLDLEARRFVAARVSRNAELPRDAQELVARVGRQLEQNASRRKEKEQAASHHAASSVLEADTYALAYV